MKRIESAKNPKIKHIKRLHKRKQREKDNQFFIEGPHLVEEALHYEAAVQEVFLEEEFSVPSSWDFKDIPVTFVPEAVMKEMSATETPQGVAAVCNMTAVSNLTLEQGRYLFIDGIQDPGNLGTIIRTADAAGLTAVILGEGTVDLYNDKVLRSTQGSVFHLPIVRGDLEDWVEKCKKKNIPVFGTGIEMGTTHTAIEPQETFALLIGNEGSGVSEFLLAKSDQNLYIPIHGKAESLNAAVAAGILLYHLRG
ncbi:TrmH family RNA methyltransferase [Thalassorhabdus alkalitolerans]|uniref:TrmH family RNA methyltransferase n=1 Tax=Thalassorhabdus alkalitolerans TaxID=2282697 RepID=A0ABW0YMQ7_9BACI